MKCLVGHFCAILGDSQSSWLWVEVRLLEGNLFVRTLEKWLSVWASEFVNTWPCKHIINMTWRQDTSNHQDNIHSVWLINGYEQQAQHLRYTFRWPWQHVCDSSYKIMRKCDRCLHSEHNSNITFNITRTRSQAWHRNQHVEDDIWSNKRKGSKMCRGNKWN